MDDGGEHEHAGEHREEQQARVVDPFGDDAPQDTDHHHRHHAGVEGAERGADRQLRLRLGREADDELEDDGEEGEEVRLPATHREDRLERGGDGEHDGGRTEDGRHHQGELTTEWVRVQGGAGTGHVHRANWTE